jgi:septum formation protein
MVSMGEPLILASASPTRKRLLAAAGLAVRVEPAVVDEAVVKRGFMADGRSASDCALALAEAKARQVAECHGRALVVGADQILSCGRVWFDKPTDRAAAHAQLQELRGQTHELVTAICVIRGASRMWHAVSLAKLTMRQFSDAFLAGYLDAEGTAILGSVGAYRLEGRGAQLFVDIKGDYFAILGLPLLELLAFLRGCGEVAR